MRRARIPQEHLAFYKLLKAYRENPEQWVNAWEFVGEIHLPELCKWELMSYKAPTRLTDIFQRNPALLERRKITGKSCVKYYQYRIAPNPTPDRIVEIPLHEFYMRIVKPSLFQ